MHNHFRRTAAFIVCLALVFGLFPVTAAAEGLSFTDVPETAWFYEDVRMAVESGLLHGRSQTRYEPEGSLTCAEAVKLAACIHRLSKDEPPAFEAGTPWYQPYAAYAKDNAIISGDLDWERAITRADFMDVFSRAIADTAARSMRLEAKNRVEDGGIPDVSQRDSRAAAIYTLYRAGIVQGVDGSGACMPDKTILRSETAAILTRMLHPEQRLSFSLYRRESTVIPVWPEAPEPDEKPDDKPETPFSVITDDYSSLDHIYSCSDVTMLGVDTGSPDAVGDDARLLRYGYAAQSYADTLVPKLSLQPIIENAITHAFSNPGTICLSCVDTEEHFQIAVSDNGCGIPEQRLAQLRRSLDGTGEHSGSIGLQNVHRRLKLLFGPDCGLQIESQWGKGTTVYLNLPPVGGKA